MTALAGCGEPTAEDQRPLVTGTSAPVDRSAPIDPSPPADAGSSGSPPTSPPSVTPSPETYEQMCRNYCEALEGTNLYYCVADGRGEATCRELVEGFTDRCETLRCVPRLVQPSLCLLQCDALAGRYSAVCGQPDAPIGEPICPVTPAASDEACRAGCALPPG